MTNADRGPFTFDIVERDRKVVYECHLSTEHCVQFTLLYLHFLWFLRFYEVCDESVRVCVSVCVCEICPFFSVLLSSFVVISCPWENVGNGFSGVPLQKKDKKGWIDFFNA